MTTSYHRMSDLPEAVREQLRVLTFGRATFVQWRWTYQTGECYCAIIWADGIPVSWACITFEDDWLPVAGCYTTKVARGKGLGSKAVAALLEGLQMRPGSAVFAVANNWPSWPKVLAGAGLVHFEWD